MRNKLNPKIKSVNVKVSCKSPLPCSLHQNNSSGWLASAKAAKLRKILVKKTKR